MDSILPPNAHKLADGRLYVSVTDIRTRRNVLVSSFPSREDLLQVRAALPAGAWPVLTQVLLTSRERPRAVHGPRCPPGLRHGMPRALRVAAAAARAGGQRQGPPGLHLVTSPCPPPSREAAHSCRSAPTAP